MSEVGISKRRRFECHEHKIRTVLRRQEKLRSYLKLDRNPDMISTIVGTRNVRLITCCSSERKEASDIPVVTDT